MGLSFKLLITFYCFSTTYSKSLQRVPYTHENIRYPYHFNFAKGLCNDNPENQKPFIIHRIQESRQISLQFKSSTENDETALIFMCPENNMVQNIEIQYSYPDCDSTKISNAKDCYVLALNNQVDDGKYSNDSDFRYSSLVKIDSDLDEFTDFQSNHDISSAPIFSQDQYEQITIDWATEHMEIHFGVITNNDEVDQDTALINVKFWRSAWRDANFSYTGYTQKEIMDIGLVAGNMKIRYDPFYLFTSQTTNSLNSGPLNANRKYRQISLRSNANHNQKINLQYAIPSISNLNSKTNQPVDLRILFCEKHNIIQDVFSRSWINYKFGSLESHPEMIAKKCFELALFNSDKFSSDGSNESCVRFGRVSGACEVLNSGLTVYNTTSELMMTERSTFTNWTNLEINWSEDDFIVRINNHSHLKLENWRSITGIDKIRNVGLSTENTR